MPQMAPMSWFILMTFFIITLIILMMLNYFPTQPHFLLKKQNYYKINSINWKW
uniref:ATP synthase F0 subunit 8 n=1 Tax=Sclerogryllus punctatus TaxID=2985483 RepID=UPI0022376919|nr:ATP synthase F0 subunit 8 [Sclerogryllus punctatus]UYE92193.1 ATP synthase F0 subunit 8 [Sclerogryllus punctatus]